MPTVVLLGTFDTKGAEYVYARDRIREFGVDTLLVDAGVFGSDVADVSRDEVARNADVDADALAASGDRGSAVEAMSAAAARTVEHLYAEGRVDGIIGLGGSGGTSLASEAMRHLPIGLPKLIVSTVASGDTRPYVGAVDITMMYSVVDIAGLNEFSRWILANAAGAIAGMVTASVPPPDDVRPLIGATMFGVTTPAVEHARERLESLGYEVLVFHATGTGGQSMEALAKDGMLSGVLDLTTTELADELVGGICAAGPDRLRVTGRAGLPQVVSLGALDMVNFGPMSTVPEKFADRNLYQHNASITLMRTSVEECRELGRRMGERLSEATGPLVVFVPQRGVSMIATEGRPFYDPDADTALITGLTDALRDDVDVRMVDVDVNDPRFTDEMVETLVELMAARGSD